MPSIGTILGIVAAIIHLTGYALYGRDNYRGQQPLNVPMWALWLILAWLNAATYLIMSGDLSKSFTAIAGACACTTVFTMALLRKSMSRFDAWDAVLFAVGLVAAAAWWHWRDATLANLILQGAFVISMLPTYRRVFANAASERPLPWFLWGTAYSLVLCVVILRWQHHWPDLAYPVINGISHTGVGLVARFGKKKTAR